MDSKLKAVEATVSDQLPQDNIRKTEMYGVVSGISAGAVAVLLTGDAFIGLITALAVFCLYVVSAVSAAEVYFNK